MSSSEPSPQGGPALPDLDGDSRRRRPVLHAELPVHVLDVVMHSTRREAENGRDLVVGLPGRDPPEHLRLPPREAEAEEGLEGELPDVLLEEQRPPVPVESETDAEPALAVDRDEGVCDREQLILREGRERPG
jgi:hypothetical protein